VLQHPPARHPTSTHHRPPPRPARPAPYLCVQPVLGHQARQQGAAALGGGGAARGHALHLAQAHVARHQRRQLIVACQLACRGRGRRLGRAGGGGPRGRRTERRCPVSPAADETAAGAGS
jgi:hypothetical protein